VPKQPLLSDIEIQRQLSSLRGWSRRADTISKTFAFPGFPEAVAFVQRLVAPAEAMAHHPDVDVRYNKVVVSLSTHDAGGITAKDLELASRIEERGRGEI
jgi:4a-hydroxytetrahydrobiopterin dehydratase